MFQVINTIFTQNLLHLKLLLIKSNYLHNKLITNWGFEYFHRKKIWNQCVLSIKAFILKYFCFKLVCPILIVQEQKTLKGCQQLLLQTLQYLLVKTIILSKKLVWDLSTLTHIFDLINYALIETMSYAIMVSILYNHQIFFSIFTQKSYLNTCQ